MQKLWHIPLHWASSTPLTTTLSMVLLTTRLLVTLAQFGAQARECWAKRTAINSRISERNSIIKSVWSHRHRARYLWCTLKR